MYGCEGVCVDVNGCVWVYVCSVFYSSVIVRVRDGDGKCARVRMCECEGVNGGNGYVTFIAAASEGTLLDAAAAASCC